MAIEQFGVRVSNPEQNIILMGESFAELVLFEHLRTENLRRCLAAIDTLHGAESVGQLNDQLGVVALQLKRMADASAGVLQDQLRIARVQGLRFEIVPTAGDLH